MKKLMSTHLLVVIIIFLIGIFLRFYMLGSVPGSLNWDEVSWGYNGYSILQTGKDEYGVFLPLSFEAFGDFKQPLYVYLESVAIFFFGLTPFAVRFPSAFLGSLSIISVYLLMRVLFVSFKHVKKLSLLTMFLFAVSPWSIQFSRVAYEANVAVFFVITGVLLLLLGLQTKRLWISLLGILIFGLSGYTYHSAKLFSPLLLLGILVYSKISLKIPYKTLLVVCLGFIIVSGPWVIDSRTTARGRSVLFTSNQTELLKIPIGHAEYDREHNDFLGSLTHNRRLVYANIFLNNYLHHFEPNFLFIGNDNPRHHPPGMGVLYLITVPFIIAGIIYIIRNKLTAGFFVFYWFLIAPLAASLAIQAPNASRSLTFLPTWDIFAAFGIVALIQLRKSFIRTLLIVLVSLGFLINFVYYVHHYFNHTNLETSFDWQFGYKEMTEFAYSKKESGNNVFFDEAVEQPYIFYLFYSSYSPSTYQNDGGSDRRGASCYMIDHVYFGDCLDRLTTADYYIVVGKDTKVSGIEKIEEITTENGIVAFSVFRKSE